MHRLELELYASPKRFISGLLSAFMIYARSLGHQFVALERAFQYYLQEFDKPQSPQSMILAGVLTAKKGTDNPVTLQSANEVLGGSTTSRLTMDLRETKGWAYGAGTSLPGVKDTIPLLVYAPVQTDKTGESIIAARQDIKDFLTTKGTTEAERNQTINGQILSLPGSFEELCPL